MPTDGRTDGRTGITEQIVIFRNFVKDLKTLPPTAAHNSIEESFYKIYPICGIRNVTHSVTQTRVLRRPNGRYPHSDC